MKKIIVRIFIAAIVSMAFPGNCKAAKFITEIPDYIISISAENNELLKLGYLDVTLYGADPTGQKDSTSAIQRAVNDARKHQLVTFFPHQKNGKRGIYLVSDTIDCRMRSYAGYDYAHKSNILIGSTKGSMRPLIRVKSGSQNFSNISDPQPVFWFWSQAGHWEPKKYQHSNNPLDNDQDISFNQMIRGIDIDLGGNPGAIGIKNPGAQGQTIENVTIHAEGAFAGLGNLAGLGSAEYDVTVIGGRYAIYIDTTKRTLSKYNGKVSLIGCKFINQKESVIRIVGRQASPIMLVGFQIENSKSIPFNIGTINSTCGGFLLIDGLVDVNGGKFLIRKHMGLYIRDVYFRGVNTIVDDWKISDTANWTQVKEYHANSVNYINLIEGKLSNDIIKSKIEGFNYSKNDLIVSLVNPHKWNERQFPSFEDQDVVNIKSLGAKGDGFTDDSASIQNAIDHYEKIFFPKGVYLISKTIVLKDHTKLIGSSKLTTIIVPHPDWKPNSEAILISTVNSKSGTAILSDILIANHGADKYANNKIDIYKDSKTPYTQSDQFNFTPLQWRVGRYSILRDVIAGTAGCWLPRKEQRNDYHRFRVNGYGGGKWFSVLGAWAGSSPNSRSMIISDSDEPMYVYPFNSARDPKNISIEIVNSRNKFFFYPAFEGGMTSFRIVNCEHIAIFSSHKNNISSIKKDRGIIEVINSSNILIAIFNTRISSKDSYNHLFELTSSSSSAVTITGKNIGLYKRGDVGYINIENQQSLPITKLRIKNSN